MSFINDCFNFIGAVKSKVKMKNIAIILLALFLASCSGIKEIFKPDKEITLAEQLTDIQNQMNENRMEFNLPAGIKFTGYEIDSTQKIIVIDTDKMFSNNYFRETQVKDIYSYVQNSLGEKFSDFKIRITSLGVPLNELIPNLYRVNTPIDSSRLGTQSKNRPVNIVRNLSKPFKPNGGLENRNIALWPSHGRYYNKKLDRWMWQRARLFQIVEDLGPLAFTNEYLVPMLERAGANVFIPRERDIQTNEVVIDNDNPETGFEIKNGENVSWKAGRGNSFLIGNIPYPANYNPFDYGTHIIAETDLINSASASYIPNIPEEGDYAVYISYHASEQNADDAHYTVYHTGGKTEFLVNQTIGGNTWIYLGKFNFGKGLNPEKGKVVLDNQSSTAGKVVSADAVRFGGGMGIIERNGMTSGMPKFMEGSRYFLQYCGMPDTLVYNINGDTLDYNDDYQSRGEWVNYLVGSPFGPNRKRDVNGLGIPIDLSLAFHTDAGINMNDTVIGTLSIYSLTDLDSNITFPDGISRFANRDLADIMQTQLVSDLRIKYDSIWTRRSLRDARYSEATRPNVPSVLLELLSHQNYFENKFQLDPRYRFDASRSIYKSMLKFISEQNGYDYVVQPLPITGFYTQLDEEGNIKLSWEPQLDELDSTAVAEKYIVYVRKGEGGFDNGILVEDTAYTYTDVEENIIYGFKVTAVNSGGESLDSEILSACSLGKDIKPLLVINGFDRVSAPASIKSKYFTGFLNNIDAGVPDKYDFSFTGLQHNFNPSIHWRSDDMPGLGASYADYESKIIAGNTFDFAYVHGKSIVKNGYAFVSSSDEAVWNGALDMKDYQFVDFIMGEEKLTHWPAEYSDNKYGLQFKVFPDELKTKISEYLENGGNIFVSGSYIGTDLFFNKFREDKDVLFGKNYLKFRLSTDHAVKTGGVFSHNESVFPAEMKFKFNTDLNDSIYAVEAPDALNPVNGSESLLRYSENQISAAVGYKNEYGVVAFGFPFETILGDDARQEIMMHILKYLLGNK